ncbi:hypothetical protein Strain138_001649 [Pseudogemmatithrix spongiicola]|uniref:Uncharacterized protein n=1 Tax=Pseudogemmatithrix spongiicola TaxID=3062599 RepID=A0AA49JUX5_9BACT|nr:hypothetical protein Strain138_001649 [Gemmatimonadaceae bacterium 'strain 138']WKW15271.1 hypothetical protein Strain318_001648 [Gemmatimonadaceae bacterium 'strain 318']
MPDLRTPLLRFLRPDHARWDGVRPIQVATLRLFYFLMAAFVATDAWRGILTHTGPWDPVRAVAVCVWAAYPTLGILGLWHPLRMLPLMLFMVSYKTLWLAAVAFPLWREGELWGTPTGDMAQAFLALPVVLLAIPWGYVWREFVRPPRRSPTSAALP